MRRYLQGEGIEEQRLRAEGVGDTMPIADNKTKEGREENRRIEVVLEASPGSGHVEAPPKEEKQEKKGRKETPKKK